MPTQVLSRRGEEALAQKDAHAAKEREAEARCPTRIEAALMELEAQEKAFNDKKT